MGGYTQPSLDLFLPRPLLTTPAVRVSVLYPQSLLSVAGSPLVGVMRPPERCPGAILQLLEPPSAPLHCWPPSELLFSPFEALPCTGGVPGWGSLGPEQRLNSLLSSVGFANPIPGPILLGAECSQLP